MARIDPPQICESDSCQVVLRNGEKLMGDMRLFKRFATGQTLDGREPLFTWVLVRKTKDPKIRAKTWNSLGCFSIHSNIVSQYDIMDFIIGLPPKGL